MAEWTAAYINDLPDGSFAVIEPGGKKDADGKTVPRSLRHLPHHDRLGKLDEPHVDNGLSRAPQTKIPAALKSKGIAHLERHKRGLQGGAEMNRRIRGG